MSSQNYELAFYGELAEGADLNDCKEKLGQLFKANPAQIERMFSGQRVVLKSKLDEPSGKKYVAALQARGAVCKLEPAVAAAPQSTSTSAAQTSTPAPVQSSPAAAEPESLPVAEVSESPAQGAGDDADDGSKERLKVAGERVNEVLANTTFNVAPVGSNLGDEQPESETPSLTMQDSLSMAPVGSDLGEKKEEKPVDIPDTSHLKLDD